MESQLHVLFLGISDVAPGLHPWDWQHQALIGQDNSAGWPKMLCNNLQGIGKGMT